MAEPILADPLTARIVQQLSNAHLRTLKRKTDRIRDFRRVISAAGSHTVPLLRTASRSPAASTAFRRSGT
ncbi:hypothetical protein [uncultured Salinicola sp.]|uniref:hypothetical protein n=1 Tax=uncultured Salinicola sp. TaxID=1193542 RepID=UPI002602190A|nr:hypothetical protein [uncultured Salinicola sp.]